MPKRTDLHKILIIGSGPIIISQACEFDYSRLFGLSLIGGGGAALYFTLFAAYRLGILPPLTALLFMVVLAENKFCGS